MKITIEQVQKNDVILEQGGKKRIEVKKHKKFACSSFGTHINDRLCYERGTVVEVERGAKKVTDEEKSIFEMDDEEFQEYLASPIAV